MEPTKVSQLQSDALREIMNMGTGHAVNALSQMLNKKVMISVPAVDFIPLREVSERVAKRYGKEKSGEAARLGARTEVSGGGVEQIVIGLYFKILGDLSGNVLLLFSVESTQRLLWLLLKDKAFLAPSPQSMNHQPSTNDVGQDIEMEHSALMEVGNILTNSYLNALAAITDFTLFPSIPYYAEDMLGAVMDYILIEISKTSDTAMFMETQFSCEDIMLSGDFLVFPEKDSLEKILAKIVFSGSER